MKRFMLAFLISFGLLCSQAFAKEAKIAVINPAKMLTEYNKAKDYDKALENKKNSLTKDLKLEEKKDEIMKMRDKMGLLKEKEQADLKDKITKALEEYRGLEEKAMADLQKDSENKMKEVVEDVEKTIKDYSQKNGIDMVLDKGAVLYSSSDNRDITDDVTKELNGKYSASKK